jgi:alpha-L-rhamnosidase
MHRLRGLSAFVVAMFTSAAFAAPLHLRCEYLENPLGIDKASPHLSWQSDNTERDWRQSAYEILVASSTELLRAGKADIWDSGETTSAESVGIVYRGPALESRQRYYWKVRVWDAAGQASESVEPAWWEMGLLHATDWKAKWISLKGSDDEERHSIRWIWLAGQDARTVPSETTATFRVTVNLSERPRDAFLVLSARGNLVATVNGHEVDAKNEWTAFDRRDISEQLIVGMNSIEVRVVSPQTPRFGPNAGAKTSAAGLAALVVIHRRDGTTMRFPTGEQWEASADGTSNWRPAQVVADLADQRLGDPGPLPQPAAYLRRAVAISRKVQKARLYATALGSYRVFLNGRRVGVDVLTPDFTDYRKRVEYQSYDVTSLLVNGKNVIGALLGDGWYGSPLTWAGMHFFPPPNRFLAQLDLTYSDGTHETIITDDSWKGAASPILKSSIYGGEVYDARLEQVGWEAPGFDDSKWKSATVSDPPSIAVSSQLTTPARVIATLDAKNVTPMANGTYIFDMGQNMVGWTTLKVKGSSGTRVQLRFAEILNPDGTIYTANLRNADATDVYILRGSDEERFSPHFTFHGFRYVEV